MGASVIDRYHQNENDKIILYLNKIITHCSDTYSDDVIDFLNHFGGMLASNNRGHYYAPAYTLVFTKTDIQLTLKTLKTTTRYYFDIHTRTLKINLELAHEKQVELFYTRIKQISSDLQEKRTKLYANRIDQFYQPIKSL